MSNSLVIIPTFNEKDNISEIIDAILGLKQLFNVLVVDDSSPDGTSEIVEKKIKIYPNRVHLLKRNKKEGLGTAYIEGFKYGLKEGYEYLFEMDADFSHNPSDLIKLYNACAFDGYDLAIGSRYIKGVNVVNWPIERVLMSFLASKYVRMITSIPIYDTTAGFKCFKRQVLKTIDLDGIKFVGYAFQIEIKFKTWKHKFKIKEVPIIFTDRTKGSSKMSSSIFKEAVFGVIQLKLESLFKNFSKKK